MAVLPRYILVEIDLRTVRSWGRTVRRYLGFARTEPFLALLVVQNELQTVRSMGADGPPLKAKTGAETW